MSRVEDRVVGNYILRSLIGTGGTSEVYAAEHRFLGTTVAIKLLREELAADDETAGSLIAEATRTREIQHPAVVRVHDVGRDETTGRCYLVMEHIAGERLAVRLREHGPMRETDVRALGAAIADGIAAAHDRGIIHRDLKPGNVMLRDGLPTIIDFGISKYLGGLAVAVTSRRIGTLAYMAPEQLVGGLISPAVDIWALGVILFEAATGKLPFDNFSDGRWPQLFDDLPPVSSLAPVSTAFDRIVERCLAREVADRYASMREVAAALRGVDDGDRLTAPVAGPALVAPGFVTPAPTFAPVGAPVRATRRRWPLAVAAAAVVVAIGLVAALSRSDSPSTTPVADDPVAAPADDPVAVEPAPEPEPEPEIEIEAAPTVTPPPPAPAAEARPPTKRRPPKREPAKREPAKREPTKREPTRRETLD